VTALVLSALLGASELERPRLVATARVSAFSGWPDLLGASATVHLIPYVDVEAGGAAVFLTRGWYVRAGPRWLFEDWRDERHRGLTLRLSALGGFKRVELPDAAFEGLHVAGAAEFTWWLASHLGLSLQLSGGGTVRAWPAFFPELRLALGASF
jgi:hypothetical protein